MTFNKLTKFGTLLGALAIANLHDQSSVQAIQLDQHTISSGIFSNMIAVENEKELREKEKQEVQVRRKKDMEEAEKEHQKLIKDEEDEQAEQDKKAIDDSEKMLQDHHHDQALERLNQLSPIALDQSNAQVEAIEMSIAQEKVKSLADAVSAQEAIEMSKDVQSQLQAIDAMNVQLRSSETPVTDDGSEDSENTVDASAIPKPPVIATVDPNATGADRFKSDDNTTADISELTGQLKTANASSNASSNATSNSSSNSSSASNQTASTVKQTGVNATSAANATTAANASSESNQTASVNGTSANATSEDSAANQTEPTQANSTSTKSINGTNTNATNNSSTEDPTQSSNNTSSDQNASASANSTEQNSTDPLNPISNKTSSNTTSATKNKTTPVSAAKNSTANTTTGVSDTVSGTNNVTNETSQDPSNGDGASEISGSLNKSSNAMNSTKKANSTKNPLSDQQQEPAIETIDGGDVLPAPLGKTVTTGKPIGKTKGVDGVAETAKSVAANSTMKLKKEKNSVNDVLPYPMQLEKKDPPSSTRAKSSPYRASKYPNNYETPSYGAPTADGSDDSILDLSQLRHKTLALPPSAHILNSVSDKINKKKK